MLTIVAAATLQQTRPPQVTAEKDHTELLKVLGITHLRPGRNGMDPKAPDYANIVEEHANPYPNIPALMTFANGAPVKTARDWNRRRKEIIELLDREIYGRAPRHTPKVTWQVTGEEKTSATVTKHLVGHVDNSSYPAIDVNIRATLVLPVNVTQPVPVMMEFGFVFPPRPQRPGAPARPPQQSGPSWQDQVLAKGWGYAILEPNTVQADNGAGLREGIIGLVNKGQPRKPDDWGALKAWSWGASRLLDYLETEKGVDSKKVGIEGISRYGKATVVAMAYEPRFAIAFVGSSGQGGVKIWRRNFGETVENLAGWGEYHWMAGNYVKYAGPKTPGDMPVDAHELLALCAPRPVFVGVGSLKVEGIWIDPMGTFMATSLASPAWEILGMKGLGTTTMPEEGTPLITGDLAFSQHHGGHTNGPNWPTFIEFASRYLNR